MFDSLIVPWPRSSLKIPCSLSPSCENIGQISYRASANAARFDCTDAAEIRFDERKRRAYGFAIRRLGREIGRADFSNCGCAPAGCADHLDRVNEYFRLVRFNRITTKRIERRGKGDRLAINGKHRFVTGISRKFFDVLVIIAKGHGETIHFDAEALLEQLLATNDFVSDPLLVCRSTQFRPGSLSAGSRQHYVVAFAQILMCRRVRLDIDSVVTHVGELFPRDRLPATQATSAYAFCINEHRKRVSKFFHDRPPDLVLRFPAVIECNDRASRWNILFATLPREQILHADYRDAGILELFHLRLEVGRCDLGAWIANFVDQPMITKNDGLGRLVDNGFGNFRRGRGTSNTRGWAAAGRRWR